MANREDIRKATLGGDISKVAKKVINIPGTDKKVEIRQLTLLEVKKLSEKVLDDKDKSKTDAVKLIAYTVIACVYEPGTENRIYDDSDFNVIVNTPSNGVFDNLYSEISDLSDISLKEAKKN